MFNLKQLEPNTLFSLFSNPVAYPFLYTQEKTIQQELKKRLQDTDLKKESERLSHLTPELAFLYERPHLVFYRQVVSPLYETLEVIKLAERLELDLVIIEAHNDKFVTAGNPYKLGLGKLPVHTFTTKRKQDIYENWTIVDFNKYNGTHLSNVQTLKGESLIELHHDLFQHITGHQVHKLSVNGSAWFDSFGNGASSYYEAFLSIFLANGVLAEIFWGEKTEKELSEKIVIPAFNHLFEKYKVKPLILNFQPKYEQHRKFYECYPNQTTDFLVSRGYS